MRRIRIQTQEHDIEKDRVAAILVLIVVILELWMLLPKAIKTIGL